MIAVTDALLDLFEPDPTTVVKDRTSAAPFNWQQNTLYAFPIGDTLRPAEAGDPPSTREDWMVDVVYIADSQDEEPQRRRLRSVSQALNDRAYAYTALLRNAPFGVPGRPWDEARVAAIDWARLRNFEVRGVSLRITGYRYL